MNTTAKKTIVLVTLLAAACGTEDRFAEGEASSGADASTTGSTTNATDGSVQPVTDTSSTSVSSGSTTEPNQTSGTSTGKESGETSTSPTSGVDPDTDPGNETTDGSETGSETGDEASAVRGRVSILSLTSQGDSLWGGGRIHARYLSDDDLVYGSGDVPDGTCAVWIHDSQEVPMSLDEGHLEISGATGQSGCFRGGPGGGYICSLGAVQFSDPFAFVGPQSDGAATVGTHLGFLEADYVGALARTTGFANPENNGFHEVVSHGGVGTILVHNPDAVTETIPDGAHLGLFEGYKAVPLTQPRVEFNQLVAASKDGGPHTDGFAVAIDVAIASAPWRSTFDPLPPKTAGDVSYDCGASGCASEDTTRWVYELTTSNVPSSGGRGLTPPTGEWASVECRGELGPDLTIPAEVLEALEGLDVADWEARLSRVQEELAGETLVRVGFGTVDYGH